MPRQHITDIRNITGSVNIDQDNIIIRQASPLAFSESDSLAFRVLTVVARPLDQPALPEIGDVWSLTDRLAQTQAPIKLAFARPPTREALRHRLAEEWDVVHFDGHGIWAWICSNCGLLTPKEEGHPDPVTCSQCNRSLTEPANGYLVFEQEDGLMDLLPATEMADLLCPQGTPPRTHLVILTACQSAMGSPSLANVLLEAGIPAVLAMRESVIVGAVATFLPPFYANLGAGYTIRQAFNAALPALRTLGTSHLSGTAWEDIPILLGLGSDTPLCERGYQSKMQVERESLVGVPAPSSSGSFYGDFEPPSEMTDSPGGRKGYLVQLAQAFLRGEKLVVLTGIGGIGKSTLAAVVVRRLAWRYPGGVFWVDGRDYLETGMRLGNLLTIFSHIYGREYTRWPMSRQRELALDYLQQIQCPTLIVVDNADVAGDDVWRFLQDVPTPSSVLVTTRTAPAYGACVLNVVAMTPREGLTFLLAEIARRKNNLFWGRKVDNSDAGNLLEIARLLDGHALALLQAGAMAADMGTDYALTQVQANPARDEVGQRFDFSYEPLPDLQKALLHRLAAFAAGFDLQAVESLCSSSLEGEKDESLTTWCDNDLLELVRASFIERQNGRFQLHPVMREYLRYKAEPETMTVLDRHCARYFLSLAGWGCDQLNNPETALRGVKMAMVERANLLAAQEVYLTQELWNETVSLTYSIAALFERSGHWVDQRRVLKQGIEAAKQSTDEANQAIFLNNLAVLFQRIGELDEAKKLLRMSLTLKQKVGNETLGHPSNSDAATLHNLGILAQQQGNVAEARRFYQQAIDVFTQLNAQQGRAGVIHQLGSLAHVQGNYTEARHLYKQSLDIYRQLDNYFGIASTTSQLGILAFDQGNVSQAQQLHEESLTIRRRIGDKKGVATDLHQLGMLAHEHGDYSEADRLCQESLEIKQQLGDHAGVASSLHQLGMLAQVRGNYAEAHRLYQEAFKIAQQCGNRASMASSLHQLGTLAQKQGYYVEAHRLFQNALDIKRQIGDRAGVAATISQLGTLASDQGDIDQARQLHKESLAIRQEIGGKKGIAADLYYLALLEETHGSALYALELICKAEVIFVELDHPHAAQARSIRERLERKLHPSSEA